MKTLLFSTLFLILAASCNKEPKSPANTVPDKPFEVIAYYTGDHENINNYKVEDLTQIIYSFLHLDGNKLKVDNAADSVTIMALTDLKKEHKNLKVLLSLGGWGGCKNCSPVFASAEGRTEFSNSLKSLLEYFNADGIDMDWEYPGIEGFPEHPWMPEDRENFTALIQEMRTTIGENYDISFAAGGFKTFFDNSIEWKKVMPLIQRVNVMTYDLTSGYSTTTGHHTPLYSNSNQSKSADFAINYLDSIGVPKEKLILGAAFYSRVWENVPPIDNGLYQPGKFKRGVNFKEFDSLLNTGFVNHWDSVAQAPYKYHPEEKLFATFDDERSVALKTAYALEKELGGIMFWRLGSDKSTEGLLHSITTTLNSKKE